MSFSGVMRRHRDEVKEIFAEIHMTDYGVRVNRERVALLGGWHLRWIYLRGAQICRNTSLYTFAQKYCFGKFYLKRGWCKRYSIKRKLRYDEMKGLLSLCLAAWE
jgi:hypothetical protein